MEQFNINQRIRHATVPDMYGTVINMFEEDDAVLVKWDGGVSQWVYIGQVRPLVR